MTENKTETLEVTTLVLTQDQFVALGKGRVSGDQMGLRMLLR